MKVNSDGEVSETLFYQLMKHNKFMRHISNLLFISVCFMYILYIFYSIKRFLLSFFTLFVVHILKIRIIKTVKQITFHKEY